MPRLSRLLSGSLLLTATLAGTGAATAGPITNPNWAYGLEATVGLPPTAANTQGCKAAPSCLTGFDISFTDNRGYYYFADRSNATVDIIYEPTNTLVGRAPGFVGQLSSNALSGPDGVVVVNNGGTYTLFAGDGNSTLRAFDVTNPAAPVPLGTTNTNGGALRLDEMAYSPSHNTILAANNANEPAYGNLISATTPLSNGSLLASPLLVPGQSAQGGMEQPVWNQSTNSWFVSIPAFKTDAAGNPLDAGGVQEFSFDGTPLRQYNFSTMGIGSCGASGLGLGSNGNLMVGCSAGGPVVLDPTGSGKIVSQLSQSSGADELWYDPANNKFYVTGVNAAGHRVIDVFDGTTYALFQEIDLTALGGGTGNAHSVAVDALSGDIFVPLPGLAGNTLCPTGCVAVFAQVPEPGSLVLLGTGLLLFIAMRRRARGLFA